MPTHTKYAAKVFDQTYEPKPTIEGVEITQIAWQSDDGGNFTEVARLGGGQVAGLKSPFEAKQLSMSILTPGAIKAFHLHYTQDDIWYTLPTERLVVNLHDVREDSPTFDTHMRLILGGGKNFSLRIPKGVAHGIANVYDRNMMMFYITDVQFDIKNPDEHRLPWDIFGTEIWDITKG